MWMMQVSLHVKPDQVEAFVTATLENARQTRQEPGNLRFDVLQQEDDPNRFQLLEAYRTQEAAEAHWGSAHFKRWREVTAEMFIEPGEAFRFQPVFPPESEW